MPNTLRTWLGLLLAVAAACVHSAPSRPKYLPISKTTAPQVEWSRTAVDDNPALPAHLWGMCSRSGPDQADATWTPTRADVEALEARLPLAIDGVSLPMPLAQYCRVYYGLVRSGRRFIYVDASPCKDGVPDTQTMVCDGGAHYWGIEYDVEKTAFTELTANGDA